MRKLANNKKDSPDQITLLRTDSAEIDIAPLVLVRNYRALLGTDSINARRQFRTSTFRQVTYQQLKRVLDKQKVDITAAPRETFPLTLQGNDLVLHIQPVAFNPRNYTPDSVMGELRRRLVRAGSQANPLLKFLVKRSGQRAEWNAWLPRHQVQLRALLSHEPPQRKIREQFYYNIQQQLLLYSDQADSIAQTADRPSRLAPDALVSQATASLVGANSQAGLTTLPKNKPTTEPAAKEALSVLYDHEFVLASVPVRRIMHVTVSDRGSSAQAQGLARYLLCVRYSTRTDSKFQGLTVADGCSPQDGYVTASTDLVQMERELFIEKIIHALDTVNLKPLSDDLTKIISLSKVSKNYLAAKDTAEARSQRLVTMNKLKVVADKTDTEANAANAALVTAKTNLTKAKAALEAQKGTPIISDSLKKVVSGLKEVVAQDSSVAAKADMLCKQAEAKRPLEGSIPTLAVAKTIADTAFETARAALVEAQAKSVKEAVRTGNVLLLDEVAARITTVLPKPTNSTGPATPRKNAVGQGNAVGTTGAGKIPSTAAIEPLDPAEALSTTTTLNNTRIATSLDATVLRQRLLDIYLDYVRQQSLFLAAPKAGTMLVHDRVKVYNIPQDRHFPAISQGTFRLDSVQMKVEDGSITDLKAVGSNDRGQAMLFESHTPIGISSDADMHNRNSWYKRYLWSQARSKPLPRENRLYIELNDLLLYFPSVENEDRSPAEGVYTFRPNDPLIRRTLTKEPTAKILQARIYTDLAGVKSDRPNGLVQVEIAKKIVFGSPWSRSSPGIQFRALGYVIPLLALNKVEEQNRYLPLSLVGATTATPFFRVNTIDLMRYTNLRIGLDLNLASMRLPQYKSDYSIDLSLYLNRVDVRDSVRTRPSPIPHVDSTLNVASYGLNVKWRVRPDSRYGIQARLGYMRYALINTSGADGQLAIEQTPDVTEIHAGAHTLFGRYFFQGVMQYELMGWLNVSKDAMFFVRPQFSHLLFQSNRTYFQMQVGYQFDVFTRRRDIPVGPPSLFPATP